MAVPPAVDVSIGTLPLAGSLALPPRATGIVVFAHGSGSDRHSPRNRQVADALAARGLATLRFDLLTPTEAALDQRTGELRFDVARLGERVALIVDWLVEDPRTCALRIGVYGASTGAAAALVAAARRPQRVAAVVSRGGRPDLAAGDLARVAAPTLLIVGGHDPVVLRLNREAQRALGGPCDLAVVPGATHMFQERGALDAVARLAGDWFARYLAPPAASPPASAPA